jgi:hypothetical protein
VSRRACVCATILSVLVALRAVAIGVMSTDGEGCPTIADHEKFGDEMNRGNFAYQYPAHCVDLPQGTRVGEPLESKTAQFGGKLTKFVLVEVAGKGKYWTLASWVEVRPGSGAIGPNPIVVSKSGAWFARLLRDRFGRTIPIHGHGYPVDEIACLPRDITNFQVSAQTTGSVFSVEGSLRLAALPAPFKVFDGAKGRAYMLELQAYLFDRGGRVTWQQQGFPEGDAWVSASGGTVRFRLIGASAGATSGSELVVLAAGDPILSEVSETCVILGAKSVQLP